MTSIAPYLKLPSALVCLFALLIASTFSTNAVGQRRGKATQKSTSRAAGIAEEADKLLEERKWPEAIDAYKLAIRLDPNYAPAHGGLGDAYFNSGNWDQGLAAYKEQVRIAPNNADAQHALGYAYNTMGRHGEAFAPLVKATSLDPSFAEAYYGIGYAYSRGADFEKSVSFFKSAIRLQPDYSDAYYGLGQAYARLGKADAANEQLKKLATIDSKLARKLEKEIQTALAAAANTAPSSSIADSQTSMPVASVPPARTEPPAPTDNSAVTSQSEQMTEKPSARVVETMRPPAQQQPVATTQSYEPQACY